jgi:predicted NBD/HSP70 family sugar kinase
MASASALKKSNVFNVIRTIKVYGPLTKPEITLRTGLASASVHNFINELLAEGIITSEGLGASSGGRKASLYKFNAVYRYIIGMYLNLREVSTFLFDLDLNILSNTVTKMDLNDEDVEKNIRLIIKQVEQIISSLDIKKIAGIGISVPGPVDYDNGVVLRLVNAPNWVNIPLQTIIRNRFGVPVIVDKINTGIVLFDKWFGQSKANSNLIHISITDGVGSGVLIGGQPYRGINNIAGEIGHITVNPAGEQCNCGNYGCVELYAGERNILARIASASVERLDEKFTIKEAIDAYKQKDPLVCRVFDEAVSYLVIAMDNVLKMFGPDELLIDCYWLSKLPELFSGMVNRIFAGNKLIDRTNVIIGMSYTDHLHEKGAAMLVYDRMFGAYETSALV